MEYIFKSRHDEAHTLIDGFLERHKVRHGLYQGDLYGFLGADFVPGQMKTIKALRAILLDEQGGRCCYCMRRIAGLAPEERSLEHVIVNHPKGEDDYSQYLGKCQQLDAAEMISSAEFLTNQTTPPPYPHSVAYENMLMSCAGRCHLGVGTSFTCNNYRGHKFVYPLPLMSDGASEVKYLKNGFVYWIKETDTENPTVELLGLNYDVLKLIRRIWYKLSSMGLDAADCDRQLVVYEVLGDMLDEGTEDVGVQSLFLFANNDWYWSLLCQYDYFNDASKFEQ
ncbi:MAG: hypothetical protein IKK87_08455 [Bacteroidaceae bacterium]|nr:hypothetical protein [Bacteroidaceae bacterium]